MNISGLTEDFVRAAAPNTAAFANAQKISRAGGFLSLHKTADNLLIFGECKGSGKNPYAASVDFADGEPVSRCTCPSRQFPCKHCLALMLEFTAGKDFSVAEIPADIARKREKREKRAENAAKTASAKKPNTAAAAKKLKIQREGLALAEQFTEDILTRGVTAVTPAACAQYRELAKQLGDYYLPEPQSIMYEIIAAAAALSEKPDDRETGQIIALCVRLAASVRKCRAYIEEKLESGDVLPEDSVLYEAMGSIWKLTQLQELGLTAENVSLLQLAFFMQDRPQRQTVTDFAYWLDLAAGQIVCTENIRPYKALRHIPAEDSTPDVLEIPLLCRYPGGFNPRVRWESADQRPAESADFRQACALRAKSIGEGVKAAKNELKNTLGQTEAALLLPFDAIRRTAEGDLILCCGEESVAMTAHPDQPHALGTLKVLAGTLRGGAVFGTLYWERVRNVLVFRPLSVLTEQARIIL